MSKTINPEEQFEEHLVTIFCDCFSKDHYLTITRADDLFEFAISDNYQPDLWERIGKSFRYIRTGPWFDQIIVNKENMQKLVKILKRELKEEKNEASRSVKVTEKTPTKD